MLSSCFAYCCHYAVVCLTACVSAGLELYDSVLSPDEQANMIHIIEDWVVQVSRYITASH